MTETRTYEVAATLATSPKFGSRGKYRKTMVLYTVIMWVFVSSLIARSNRIAKLVSFVKCVEFETANVECKVLGAPVSISAT